MAGGFADGAQLKARGDAAFAHGEFGASARFYTERLQLRDSSERVKILSNRSAAYVRVERFRAALADADAAVSAAPGWSRAHARRGAALAALGRPEPARAAFVAALAARQNQAQEPGLSSSSSPSSSSRLSRAAALEDESVLAQLAALTELEHGELFCGATLSAAEQATSSRLAACADAKELGDAAFREGGARDGAALGAYSAALARYAPRDERLWANRAAVLLRQRCWDAALRDARHAIELAPSWARGYLRAAAALAGARRHAHAYWYHARAVLVDSTSSEARRGAVTTLAALVDAGSQVCERRYARDAALSSARVFAVSDVHFDHPGAREWARGLSSYEYRRDALLLAGDVADTLHAVKLCLECLRPKFNRIFYVPGNHDLWIRPRHEGNSSSPSSSPPLPNEPELYPDSIAKFIALLELCEKLDVDTGPAEVCCGVHVVPLLSWYDTDFDATAGGDGRGGDPAPPLMDTLCRWPVNDADVPSVWLRWNEKRVRRAYDGTVITFSHFLPRRELPFSKYVRGLAKVVGCQRLDEQLRSIQPTPAVHVFGHSHIKCDQTIKGVRYLQHALGYEHEHGPNHPLLCVYDGNRLACRAHSTY